jgi:hypothetical protein
VSLLGRLSGLGRALIARGLAGIGGGSTPVVVVPVVEGCVTRAILAGPAIVRVLSSCGITREIDPVVTVCRLMPSGPVVTRTMPSC